MDKALDTLKEYLEPLGYEQGNRGPVYVFKDRTGLIHKLKPSQFRPATLCAMAPMAAWREAFPVKPAMPVWLPAYDWLMQSCVEKGIYQKPAPIPKETTYDNWLQMNVGDWFYTEGDPGVPSEFHIEKYGAISYHVNNSKHRKNGAVFKCTWIDAENRGRIERIA